MPCPSFTKEYLEQFIGKYTYMGFTFTVEASGESLIVKAFGQPPYDLVPSKENMFLIRGMEGYSVHFTPTTIQLIQPNQTSYIANKL